MSPNRLRDQVCKLVHQDWRQALMAAEQITDPWYAAQALGWVGRFASKGEQSKTLAKAFRRAAQGKDAYTKLAGCAWPLRALLELHNPSEAQTHFEQIHSIAPAVEPIGSRAEACLLIFHAMAIGTQPLAFQVYHWLMEQIGSHSHWRSRRAIADASLIAITLRIATPDEAANLMTEGRLRESFFKKVGQGPTMQPRPFFWA